MAPSKEVSTSSNAIAGIDADQTLKAAKALLAHMKKTSSEKANTAGKKNLLASPDDETSTDELPIWLNLTTKRHIVESNRKSLKPGKIVLPHSLNTDPAVTICLISADPQRAYKNLIASEEFPEEWRKRVTRVVDVSKLKSKFKTYEELRKLFAEHDVFLGDSRIINRLPKVLGKTFYKTTAKRPIPVDIQKRVPKVDGKKVKHVKGGDHINICTPKELAAEIAKAVGTALVNLTPSTSTAIRIGYAGWTAQQIADNANTVASTLVEKYVPQKWQNVRSIYIKGPETAALPVWLTDELWLEEKDIVANGEETKSLMNTEKANIGKKRKSLDGPEETAPAPKKVKKAKVPKLSESSEDKLAQEIAERKSKLKKQKAAAKKALEV
ncbi:electron transfer flavo protein alpha-subunit [Pseudomassariella vexata]|uniref:Electron transfer flavo protein alpha-subunit n=1 Tax=Pseudomassariella vexata TaxID=1141098 RepID=A0A1Y2E006_9PEZI|nr:electron transfer flavo protein alpha-subunit [Pseudomassariella vexata]ORY64863.1 electron transfer flavo protein alpha-subunit [Pseudomassariella vexata]